MEFEILEVLRFERKSGKKNTYKYTKKRDFSVISCRLYGDTEFYFNGKTVAATPYDYVVIPASAEYSQRSADEEIICIHLAFDNPFFETLTSVRATGASVTQHFLELYECWQQKRSGFMLRCKALVYEILYQLFSASDDGRLSPAVDYMKAYFDASDFSLSAAIAKTHLSSAYFRRLFKVSYGMTPLQYVTRLRIDRAKALLEGGIYPIYGISEMCGFSDEKYFYSVFKKQTGTTPSNWRNRK